jgi:hypothetical protein
LSRGWKRTTCLDERQSASGHYTMEVGVMFELLIPGMEHAKQADLGTEMLGIASDFEECFGLV